MPEPRRFIPAEVAERAYTNVTHDENGCWISNFTTAGVGYSHISHRDPTTKKDMTFLGHRASWTHVHGQIRDGYTIDHQCYTRACVNPDHLREISLAENSRRRNGAAWPLGQCRWGHPDSEQTEVIWGGKPRHRCAACQKERNDRHAQINQALRLLELAYGLGGHETKRSYANEIRKRDARVEAVRMERQGLAA